MEQVKYKSNPQVNTGFKDLINAIILRSVQDCLSTDNKKRLKNYASQFLLSDEFEYMCECVQKDWAEIRRIVFKYN